MPIKLKVTVAQIIKLYTINQLTATQVAKELDIAIATVLKYLRNNNIKIRNSFKCTQSKPSREIPLDINKLIRLYNIEHLPSTEIAKRFNITSPTIIRRLKILGIPINPKYGSPYHKYRIKEEELPDIIMSPKMINQMLTGKVKCPTCNKTRRLTLNRERIKAILQNKGRCNSCTMKARTKTIDINKVFHLYHDKHIDAKKIAKQFHIGVRTLYEKMKNEGIPRRTKGDTRVLFFRQRHPNKGTLEHPMLGDVRKGLEIGLNNISYYQWVQCEKCKGFRWEAKSRIKKYPICKPCVMILSGEKHSGENSPMWLGGISFEPYAASFNNALKRKIRERDNYTCQLCGLPQNGKSLAVHHIDYNKKNNLEPNLISLCPLLPSCHNKTNHNRGYWQEYFTKLIIQKYP